MDHAKAICGLNACPLKPVVEDRVFVGKQIESRGMLHDLDAHVAHVIFREQGVEVIADAADGTGHNRQREFQSNEIPETGGDWLVRGDHAVDSIDDQLAANPSNCQRQQRGNQAKENSPCDDRAPRVPHNSKDNRYIAQGGKSFTPAAQEGSPIRHWLKPLVSTA